MLEALKAKAHAGDEHAQLLLAHLVEESGAADEVELIEAQRNRVEEMRQWQQEQLRLHAEAVARSEQRSAQRKALHATSTVAAPAAVSVNPGSAAAATSHQIDERKHGTGSSASAAASASSSLVKANNGHGSPHPPLHPNSALRSQPQSPNSLVHGRRMRR